MRAVSVCVAAGLLAASISFAENPPPPPAPGAGNVKGRQGERVRGDREGGRQQGWNRGGAEGRAPGNWAEARRPDVGGTMIEQYLTSPDASEIFGLDDAKIEEMKNALEKIREKSEALENAMREAADEQAKLMSAETLDKEALMAAVKKTGDLRTEIATINVERLMLVRQNLSREQMEQVQQKIRERMREQMKNRGQDRARQGDKGPGNEGKKGGEDKKGGEGKDN